MVAGWEAPALTALSRALVAWTATDLLRYPFPCDLSNTLPADSEHASLHGREGQHSSVFVRSLGWYKSLYTKGMNGEFDGVAPARVRCGEQEDGQVHYRYAG